VPTKILGTPRTSSARREDRIRGRDDAIEKPLGYEVLRLDPQMQDVRELNPLF
jgi:hypothetical protein